MSLLQKLFGRVPDADTPPPAAPQPPTRPALVAPVDDDDADMLVPDESGVIDLEEIYTIIDYVDAKGQFSRRRITMRSITSGSKGPILKAICHERKAIRAFRCDRIDCFIDDDGEVTEGDDFFKDILRIDLSALHVEEPEEPHEHLERAIFYPFGKPGKQIDRSPAKTMRDKLNPQTSVLVALARCDGLHDTEVAAILNYIECEAFAPDRGGQFGGITIQDVDDLEPVIRRMRPSRSTLKNNLNSLSYMTEPERDRFYRALRKVIHADGQISQEEIDTFSIIEEWNAAKEKHWRW